MAKNKQKSITLQKSKTALQEPKLKSVLDLVKQHELTIENIIPDGFGLVYSDHAYVQSSEDEFIISFFQLEHPLFQTEEDIKKAGKIKAYCVARIVVTPKQMFKLVTAMQINTEKYKDRMLKLIKEQQEANEKAKEA